MKKILILMVFIISVVANAFAYGSAEIKKVWLEHGVISNSEKGIMIHIEFSARGVKGHNVRPCAYFYNEFKIALKGGISGYKTSSGEVSISETSRATYNDSYWKDFKLFMPLRAIPMTSGKHIYYVKVDIYDDNQRCFLATSNNYISFTGTGSGNNSNRNYQAHNHQNSNNNSGRRWREDAGYGMFYDCQEMNGGMISKTLYGICTACRGTASCGGCYGTATCSICQGRGGIITSGYGRYIPCAACYQTGKCQICKGSGKCVCASGHFPGYIPGANTLYGADGRIISTNSFTSGGGSSSGSSSSSRSRSSSSRGSCSRCGGTGIDPSPNSGGGLSSWMAYHNNEGNKCPYCGHYTSHNHDRCSSCNVPR